MSDSRAHGRQPAFGTAPPGMRFVLPGEGPKGFWRTVRRFAGRLRPERRSIALGAVFGTLGVVFAVAGTRLLGYALDVVFRGAASPTGVDFEALRSIVLVLTGAFVLNPAFSWAQTYVVSGATQRTAQRLRRDVHEKLARLPIAFFDSRPRGDTLSRVTNDIDNVSTTLQQALNQVITAAVTFVGVLAVMIWISPLLAAIALLTVPASLAITALIARRSQKLFAAQWRHTGALNGHIEEIHTGHNVVMAFGREREAIARFDEENDALFEASYGAQFVAGLIQPLMALLANVTYVAVAVVGAIRVTTGQMTLGDVIAFITYSGYFRSPILQVTSFMNALQSAVASGERVLELLDEAEEEPETSTPNDPTTVLGRIGLEDMAFRYLPETPLIDGLRLDVAPGHTIAIVGPTGAGKTTLVNLLLRFYEIDRGRIFLDGVDVRSMTRNGLRGAFGMVLQDTWLFHGTIRENIAYGREGATEAEIVEAARAARADHFIRTLPDGYDTLIDEEASNLSQGEKQLLTIARAFLADPPILILDEATSSVDARTEALIQRAMSRLATGRTSFVIAHRLSTIRDAHTILVMDRGRIVEQGTHVALLARGGFYRELNDSQFDAPLEAST